MPLPRSNAGLLAGALALTLGACAVTPTPVSDSERHTRASRPISRRS